MLDFSERLFSLLASPYSYIQIRTWEEDRIVRTVRALSEQMGRTVVEWSPSDAEPPDLLGALTGLANRPGGTVLVLKDAHPYLGAPAVVRKMRELEAGLASQKKACVLVSPFVELPPELLKDVSFLDAPLPGRIELGAVLEEVFPPAELAGLDRERIVAGALGLTQRETGRAFHRARFERRLSRQKGVPDFDIEAAVIREKRRLIEADRVLEFSELARSMDDVGGLTSLKQWLEERARAFGSAAHDFGLPTPRGLLLTGVQGCGKSLFAKAVSAFWGIPLLKLDFGRLFDGSIAPESALQRAIQTAEALSPAVLWVDEIDKAFADDAGAVSRMMGSLLGWLQDKSSPVFFVATANRVQHLPPELLRKGRFDEVFFVDLPSEQDRAEILRIHIRRRGREPLDFDTAALAASTAHFSGAELEQVVVSALFKAFARDRDLAQEDLVAAVAEIVPLYRTYEEDIKAQREWAETRARPAARDSSLFDLFKSASPKGAKP